jgi:hypothetical protein
VQDPLLQQVVGRANLPAMQEEIPLELGHSLAVERQPPGGDTLTRTRDGIIDRGFALHPQRSVPMFSHKFNNGQTVHAKENPCATLDGAYEIVCRMPMSGGDKQYWVKSLENGAHRVVRQSDLVSGPETDHLRPELRHAGAP